jgi:Ribbon-helix-helix protein, copG family
MRRNAFAGAGEPGGPSLLALWEMPELASGVVMLRRGHPGKGTRRTTSVRSVRLPEELWKELERTARAKHLNLHQAMRAALLGWIRRAS